MSILRFLFQTLRAFLQIKDRKHIKQNYKSVARVMSRCGTWGAGWVKNLSVGICDGCPSTAHSSLSLSFSFHIFFFFFFLFLLLFLSFSVVASLFDYLFISSFAFDLNGLVSMF